jgi:hypothetical protein
VKHSKKEVVRGWWLLIHLVLVFVLSVAIATWHLCNNEARFSELPVGYIGAVMITFVLTGIMSVKTKIEDAPIMSIVFLVFVIPAIGSIVGYFLSLVVIYLF